MMVNRLVITLAVVALAALMTWAVPNGLRSSSPNSMATEIAPSAPLR